MADFASVYAKNYKEGELSQDWIAPSNGVKLAAGYPWGSKNYVLCLKITLSNPAKSITLSFCNAPDGYSVDQSMRYKFTTAEDDSLVNATSDTPGDGSFTVEGGAYVRTTITIEKVLTAGTHYLYIWTNLPESSSKAMWIFWNATGDYSFIGSYEALEGFSWIKDSAGVNPYHSYIKTAEGVVLHAPYVFDGTNWNPLS